MTHREKLIELLENAPAAPNGERNVATLADHLLENGIIVPPCKVGQTVYSCLGYAYKVKKIVIESNSKHITFVLESGLNGQLIFDETCFGKTVFLSHEDAGKALAERSKE